MINRWRGELNSFSLRNSSFGGVFDKRYSVLKSLFQHFEKQERTSNFHAFGHHHFGYNHSKKSKTDRIQTPSKFWETIPGVHFFFFVLFC